MSLEALFEQTHNLPNIPKVVKELIDSFNDEGSNADDISKKVQMDQVISAKVMRLANSARFGAGRNIPSIDAAVVMLGFNTLKTLVVASGITGAFKDVPGLDKKQFWKDGFTVASISKLVGKHAKLDAETSFTVGMMANIGELLIHISHSDTETKLDKFVASGADRIELQKNEFGYDYTEVGEELAKRWNFPEEIQLAIRQQCSPLDFEEFSPLSGVIHIATYVNESLKKGKNEEEMLHDFPNKIASKMNIKLVEFLEDVIELSEKHDDIDDLLG
jgi:HD-like signal output (HDOD) protein